MKWRLRREKSTGHNGRKELQSGQRAEPAPGRKPPKKPEKTSWETGASGNESATAQGFRASDGNRRVDRRAARNAAPRPADVMGAGPSASPASLRPESAGWFSKAQRLSSPGLVPRT